MEPTLAPESCGTAPLKRRDQELPKLMTDRNWEGLRPGGQMAEILPMKAGKSISNVVMNARNMLRGESKIKTGRCR